MGIPTYSSWHAATHTQEEHGMDPTTVCCPNRHCPARGHTGRGNIGSHAQKERRCICPCMTSKQHVHQKPTATPLTVPLSRRYAGTRAHRLAPESPYALPR